MHRGSRTGWFGVHGAAIQVNPLLYKYTFIFYYVLLSTLLFAYYYKPKQFQCILMTTTYIL